MTPTISSDFLEKERQRNEESFRREYRAQFTDHITGWSGAETLQQCVTESCTERPRVNDAIYAAAADPAFKGNDFALAIAHRSNDGTIILDHTATWTGTREASLGYEWICREIARTLKRYDQHCGSPVLVLMRPCAGIFPSAWTSVTCLGFKDLRPSLVSIQRVESTFRCS